MSPDSPRLGEGVRLVGSTDEVHTNEKRTDMCSKVWGDHANHSSIQDQPTNQPTLPIYLLRPSPTFGPLP